MSDIVAFYNEIDPAAAAWLRWLIDHGHIAPGVVDTRSITEIQPHDLDGFTQVHFFAGIGGWSHAARLAGWPDDRPLWTGSCPCQPFSVAGKGAGSADARHLWPDFHRLISARRPAVVMGEQVAGAAGYGWFDGVAADLASENYASRYVDIPSCAVDAPHIRQRGYWIAVANAESQRGGRDEPQRGSQGRAADGRADAETGRNGTFWSDAEWLTCHDGKARRAQPGIPMLVNGLPGRVAAWRGFGNAINPVLAAEVIAAFLDVGDTT